MYRVYKIDIIIIYNSCVCTICEKHKTILCTKKNTTVNDLEYIYIPLDTRTHTHTHTHTHTKITKIPATFVRRLLYNTKKNTLQKIL